MRQPLTNLAIHKVLLSETGRNKDSYMLLSLQLWITAPLLFLLTYSQILVKISLNFKEPDIIISKMSKNRANINRQRVFSGVIILCGSVLLMIVKNKDISLTWQLIWLLFFGLGIYLYIWGRFFSKPDE